MIVDKHPLNEDQKKILKALEKGPLGFNSLYRELECRPSRATLKKYLDKLESGKLIDKIKAGRKGQEDSYESTALAKKLMDDLNGLERKWERLTTTLENLDKIAQDPCTEPEEAADILAYLIHTSQLVTEGLAAYAGYSEEIREKIMVFSVGKFYEFLEKTHKVLENSPKIEKRFNDSWKGSSDKLLSVLESKIHDTVAWKIINNPECCLKWLDHPCGTL
jgi:DNA-binding HxlR family transcriptional regulator